MLDKQKLRESISQVLDANSYHEFKYIDEEILNSKEFIQKIYRKNFKLFNWLPLYINDKEIWKEVIEEQEKIKLGNAFTQFCRDAKLIKPNHNIDLDDMTSKENSYFKAFKQMYDMNQEMKTTLLMVSDYATYVLACDMDNTQEFNFHSYVKMQDHTFVDTLARLAKEKLDYVEDKGYV